MSPKVKAAKKNPTVNLTAAQKKKLSKKINYYLTQTGYTQDVIISNNLKSKDTTFLDVAKAPWKVYKFMNSPETLDREQIFSIIAEEVGDESFYDALYYSWMKYDENGKVAA